VAADAPRDTEIKQRKCENANNESPCVKAVVCTLELTGSLQCLVASSFRHGNEPSGSIRGRELFDSGSKIAPSLSCVTITGEGKMERARDSKKAKIMYRRTAGIFRF
jgi:hypothetical protein